jgi:hypothetical protein
VGLWVRRVLETARFGGEVALLVVVSERELDVVEGRVALTGGLSGG